MDPTRQGIIKWSSQRAHEHLQAVIPASIGIPLVALIAGQLIALPKNPTTADRITQGTESLIVGVLVVAVLALLYAIVVAPYEQRNALRRQLADVTGQDNEMRWAEERRSVYSAFLDAVWPWIGHIRHWIGPYWDDNATVESLRAEEGPFNYQDVFAAMKGPQAEIGLIGSREAEAAVKSLVAQLIAFEATVIGKTTLEGLQRMAAECDKRYERVRWVFRKDLGISSAEPAG